jgi:ribonuclease HI
MNKYLEDQMRKKGAIGGVFMEKLTDGSLIKQRDLIKGVEMIGVKYEFTIEFDGGTPMNSAKRGFGEGYGSFCVNGGKIIKRQFGIPMSNNVAEVSTLILAIRFVQMSLVSQGLDANTAALHIIGDSTIALNRCHKAPKANWKGTPQNPDFIAACSELYQLCRMFHSVKTEWRGREASVRLFGH